MTDKERIDMITEDLLKVFNKLDDLDQKLINLNTVVAYNIHKRIKKLEKKS